jgi:hypothetical protein
MYGRELLTHSEEEEKYDKMSEEDIGVWCSRYKDAKGMEAYIMDEKKEPRSQERFVTTLTKVAVIKDNPNVLVS